MKKVTIKTVSKYFLYTLLGVVFLTLSSCKKTYYEYDIEKICKECKNKGGVNRFTNDLGDIIVYCKDGTKSRLK
jgi:hypothetical protein